MTTEIAPQLVLACAVCVLGTCIGFNRPSWSRSYTTAARYRTALFVHASFYAIAYFGAFILLRKLLPPAGSTSGESAIAVMWLAVLLVWVLRSLSSRPRAWLHWMAGIPSRANCLAASLADSELNPSASVAEQARAALLSRGIDVDSHWLPLAEPTYRLLLQATMLFLQIRQWEKERPFASFMREARNDVDLLRRRFDRLSLRISRSLASIERLGEVRLLYATSGTRGSEESESADNRIRKIVADLLADSCEDIRAFHEDACLLTARAALLTKQSRKGRNALLRTLGFELKARPDTIGYGFLAATAILLYAGMWIFFLMLPAANVTLARRELVTIVSLIVFVALLIAIVPKLHWGFANAGLHPRTPIAFVLGAGTCAVMFAVLIQLTAGAMLVGGVDGAIARLREGSPWFHAAFLTASTMAWLVQDHRWLHIASARIRRLLDGLVFGVVWLVISVTGSLLQARMMGFEVESSVLTSGAIGSFVIGGLLGLATAESARHTELRARVPAAPSFTALTLPNPALAQRTR